MADELNEEFKDLSYRQIRFLQSFVSNNDSEPDIVACMSEAGYKIANESQARKVGRNLLRRFANNNKLNFQRLLSYSIPDIDLVGKLASLLGSDDEKVQLSALKLITNLKGYDEKQESHAGSTIVIEIVGESEGQNTENSAITTIDTATLRLGTER